jgi:hypothetical protein
MANRYLQIAGRKVHGQEKPGEIRNLATVSVNALRQRGRQSDFPNIPMSVEGMRSTETAVMIAGEAHKWVVRVHNHEANFAPPGKTVLTSAIFTNHAYWKALEKTRAYDAEKECSSGVYQSPRADLARPSKGGDGQHRHPIDD